MGLAGRRCWRRNHLIALRDDVLVVHRLAVVGLGVTRPWVAERPQFLHPPPSWYAASDPSVAVSAAATAAAARVVAAAVAGVFAIGWIAVEIAPISLAAVRTAPVTSRKQGEKTTERSTIPATAAAAVAARIGTGVATARAAAGVAARPATAATRSLARPTASGVAAIAAIVPGGGSPRSIRGPRIGRLPCPARRTATVVARIAAEALIATASATARPTAEDFLQNRIRCWTRAYPPAGQ